MSNLRGESVSCHPDLSGNADADARSPENGDNLSGFIESHGGGMCSVTHSAYYAALVATSLEPLRTEISSPFVRDHVGIHLAHL